MYYEYIASLTSHSAETPESNQGITNFFKEYNLATIL